MITVEVIIDHKQYLPYEFYFPFPLRVFLNMFSVFI